MGNGHHKGKLELSAWYSAWGSEETLASEDFSFPICGVHTIPLAMNHPFFSLLGYLFLLLRNPVTFHWMSTCVFTDLSGNYWACYSVRPFKGLSSKRETDPTSAFWSSPFRWRWACKSAQGGQDTWINGVYTKRTRQRREQPVCSTQQTAIFNKNYHFQ